MKTFLTLTLISLQTLFVSTNAVASDCSEDYFLSIRVKNKCDEVHYLPLGVGVASPSLRASYLENPAGFAYNKDFKFHAAAAKGTDSGPWRYSAMSVLGNGEIGGGLEFNRYDRSNSSLQALSVFTLGAAAAFESVAAGLSFSRVIQSTSGLLKPDDSNYLSSNFGFIFNPRGIYRAGLTIYDAFHGITGYGAGIATSPTGNLTAAFDAVISGSTKRGDLRLSTFKVGMGTGFSRFLFSAGFGVSLSDTGTGVRIPTGLSASLGILIAETIRVLASYNQTELFYCGLTISI